MLSRLRPHHLRILEAGLIGAFFVQALRLLIGLLYSRTASAALFSLLPPEAINRTLPGIVEPGQATSEVSYVVYMLALPLLALFFGRVRWLILIAVVITALGRSLLVLDTAVSDTVAAATIIGGSLLYIAVIIRQRAQMLPYVFIFGFAADQLLRAAGNTLDPSLSPAYSTVQIILSLLTILIGFITVTRGQEESPETIVSPEYGLMPLWGGIGLGALLFLEIILLALPNAIAGRADVDYTTFVPLVLAATLLPIIPAVRAQARAFISAFDGGMRGWLWLLGVALLLVVGTRLQGIMAGIALVVMQFAISLMWWWVVRPQAEKERNLSGLWLIMGTLLLGVLLVGDIFTYEYAFVRGLATPSETINTLVPSLLRGFRGMGLGLLLLGVFLAALPMTQTRRRVPWPGGTARLNVVGVLIVALASVGAAFAARPPLITGVRDVNSIRLGTYNIHAGYNEFFHYDLEAIAQAIEVSGANVVLLQEVEAGRSTSFGVDQTLWLARRLKMDRRFYGTNEGLQGLAVLSDVEIVFDEGTLLTSTGQQTGIQRVQILPDVSVVTVYNTWLGLLLADPGSDTLAQEEQDQQQQLNEIFAIISRDHPSGNFGRLVLGGTFNNTPASPLIQQLRDPGGFRDPFAGQPAVRSYTLQRTNLDARIDYLWLRPPLLEISAGVMETGASDHRMAVIELQIASRSG